MKILYLARHTQRHGNDDEGAITHALRGMGHAVTCLEERFSYKLYRQPCHDLLLLHHCHDLLGVSRWEGPKVFWCFDRIDFPRGDGRRAAWANEMLRVCDLGFFTDGDWVDRDLTYKSRWLPQGADARVVRRYQPTGESFNGVLVVAGVKTHDPRRATLVGLLRDRYKDRFRLVEHGVYREALGTLAAAGVVVCPDAPVTDRYWSNRVYGLAGLGAVVVHPASAGLESHYPPGMGVAYYPDRRQLPWMIDQLLSSPASAEGLRNAAVGRTAEANLYSHRLRSLLDTVRDELKVG